MAQPNMLLLYVADVASSATFYASLLGHAPIEQSVNFAMLPLAQGVMLGLWARQDEIGRASCRERVYSSV